MDKQIVSEQELKTELGLKDWNELSKEKILKMIQLSPQISDQVYVNILNQVPQLVEETKAVISALKTTIDQSTKLSLEHKKFFNELSLRIFNLLDSDKLSDQNKSELIQLLKLIPDYMDKADARDKEFLTKQLNNLWDYGGKALLVLAAVLGVKFLMKAFEDRASS